MFFTIPSIFLLNYQYCILFLNSLIFKMKISTLFFWLALTQEKSHKGPTNSFTSSSPEPGRSETRHRWDISNGSDLLCGVTITNVSINVYIVTLPWQHIHSNKILLFYSFIKDKHLIYLLMVYPSRPINQQLLISTLFPIWLRLRPQQLS